MEIGKHKTRASLLRKNGLLLIYKITNKNKEKIQTNTTLVENLWISRVKVVA